MQYHWYFCPCKNWDCASGSGEIVLRFIHVHTCSHTHAEGGFLHVLALAFQAS